MIIPPTDLTKKTPNADEDPAPLPVPTTEDPARFSRLCIDPDLTGDATLFAVCLQAFLSQIAELGPAERRVYSRNWWFRVGSMAKPNEPAWKVGYWVRSVIAEDLPRYEPEGFLAPVIDTRCEAPMVRREGPCGKPPTVHVEDRDPLTGAGRVARFCTRHKAHAEPLLARHSEWLRNGTPEPEPNKGGVLQRYFATDWESLYRWASSRMPADGAKPPTLPPPILKIIPGGSTQ